MSYVKDKDGKANIVIMSVYSFHASCYFCHLLITFANSLDPDHDQMSVLIWIQTIWHSDSVPDFFFFFLSLF